MALSQSAAYFARKRRRKRNALAGDATIDITGTALSGETLTAVFNNDDTHGASAVLAYVWLRGAVVITGASGVTYELSDDDVGEEIKVRAEYRDSNQRYWFAVSDPTAEVA